jgi:hypothetical protein
MTSKTTPVPISTEPDCQRAFSACVAVFSSEPELNTGIPTLRQHKAAHQNIAQTLRLPFQLTSVSR